MGVNKRTISTYWGEIRKYKSSFFTALILIPLSQLFLTTLLPYGLSQAIGSLSNQNGNEMAHYLWLAGWMGGLGILANLIGFQALTRQEANIHKALSHTVLSRILGKDMTFFVNEKIGALTSRYINFISAHVKLQDLFIMETLGFVLSFGIGITILALNSPIIALVVGGLTLIILVIVRLSMKIRAPWRHARKTMIGDIHGRVADTITNSLIVKTFANERQELDALDKDTTKYKKLWVRDIGFATLEGSSRHVIMVAAQIIAVFMCGTLVLNGQMELGIAIFVLAYLQRLASQLFSLGQIVNGYDRALLDAAPMSEIMHRPIKVEDAVRANTLQDFTPQIQLQNVTYRYSDSDEDVLKGINLNIKPGEKIGLVGHSGAGKTTVTSLLLRFADVTDGSILIDGHDIREITQASLRRNIAYVQQEPMLFHRSLRENISYGKLDATDNEIIAAAKKANAWEFIEKLPQGLDTLVGERGVKLSGGQRQRIAIARAILKDAPILVLDEATSALDSESEKLIQDALMKLMKGRTSIVIAHRLSTIARLDRIIVLDKGIIAEQGTHQQLLTKNGIYASLWNHQSGGFIEE